MSTLYELPSAGSQLAIAQDARDLATQRLPLWVVLAIVLAYALPGLTGHDPWKQDEAYIFGGIYDMLKTGDWVVVKVGGVPFMEKPPLYHWVGAATATLFSAWLPLHDGARLASGLFVAIGVLATALASRLAWGRGSGRVGALMTVSTLGLVTNAQLMLPDLPLMAGFAVAIAGLVACHRRLRWGGALLGVGIGIGFLAKGLIAPCIIGASAIALPVAFREWRSKRYLRDLAIALAAALPFLIVWPAALWLRSHELFMQWLWENNVGRYLGFSVSYLGAAIESGYWAQTFPWFLFPLWLFVGTALIRERSRVLEHAGNQIGLTLAACTLAVLVTSASARGIYALPMVPALALVAAGVARKTAVRIDRVLFVLGLAFAALLAAVVWYGWASLTLTSNVPDWPWLMQAFPAEYFIPVSAGHVALAALLTFGFAALAMHLRGARSSGLAVWVGTLALGWGLPALLWLPWIDHAKSYRGMYESMARAIPANVDCVASLELGESERAVLEYVLNIPTIDPGGGCEAVIRQRRTDKVAPPFPQAWRLAWAGSRPGDHRERFELWLRSDKPSFVAGAHLRNPR